MGGQLVEGQRITGFLIDPDEPLIVGHDAKAKDKAPHLWVPDADDPVDMGLVQSMLLEGGKTPIEIQKIGDYVYVVLGRGRTKAARYIKKHHNPDFKLKAIGSARGASQAEIMAGVMSENMQRKRLRPIHVMEQIAYYVRMNPSDDAIPLLSGATGISAERIDKLLSVRESPVVLKALKAGQLDIEGAIAISGIPAEEQEAKMAELLAQAKAEGKTKVNTETARAAKTGKYKRPSPMKIERTLRLLESRYSDGGTKLMEEMLNLIRFCTGRVSVEKINEQFRDAYKAVLANEDRAEIKEKKKKDRAAARAEKKGRKKS